MTLAPEQAAMGFLGGGARCTPHPGGHINASWVVDVHGGQFFLQRLNRRVFPDPRAVMRNVVAVTAHVRALGGTVTVPRLLVTEGGVPWLEDGDEVWRCMEFVAGESRPMVRHAVDAMAAGRAFGGFSALLSAYEGPPLAEVLPGFHDTAARCAALEAAAAADPLQRLGEAAGALRALLDRRAYAGALAGTDLPRRLAHNDAKIGNLLFDLGGGRARYVVDLDTVMPGSPLHDFGDLVRSAVAPGGEEEPSAADPALFAALAEGFLDEVGPSLAPAERDRVELAGRVLTFEQAVRFLTDHLQGDRYYRVSAPGQNLARARAQLALLQSLETQADRYARVVAALLRG